MEVEFVPFQLSMRSGQADAFCFQNSSISIQLRISLGLGVGLGLLHVRNILGEILSVL